MAEKVEHGRSKLISSYGGIGSVIDTIDCSIIIESFDNGGVTGGGETETGGVETETGGGETETGGGEIETGGGETETGGGGGVTGGGEIETGGGGVIGGIETKTGGADDEKSNGTDFVLALKDDALLSSNSLILALISRKLSLSLLNDNPSLIIVLKDCL